MRFIEGKYYTILTSTGRGRLLKFSFENNESYQFSIMKSYKREESVFGSTFYIPKSELHYAHMIKPVSDEEAMMEIL